MAVERPPQGGGWKPTPPPAPPKPPASTGGGSSGGSSAPVGNQSAGAAPLTAAGGTPTSKYQWATALVAALGGTPTPGIINLIIAWIDGEGTRAAWNPLAITAKAPGSTPFNDNNGYPVQNFTSFEQGVQMTAHFIQNGRYNNILAAIRSGDPNVALAHAGEFDTWGTGGAHVTSLYRQVSGDSSAGAGALLAAAGGGGPSGAGSGAASYIMQTDPSLEWALGVPELAGILQNAAAQQWTDAQLTAALQGSAYYRGHSDSVRAWQALQQTDPSTAARDLQAAEASLRAEAASLGLTLSDSALAGLAMGQEMFQWTADEIHQHLLAASAFSQSGSLGAVGDGAVQAKQLFAEYGIKLDDATAQAYGTQINVASDKTTALENLRPTAIAQAKGLFPGLSDLLDQGVTVANVFSPYQSAAASLLEKDPSQIDLTDPKFARAIQGDQKQGQMSLQQWQSTLMQDPAYQWNSTENAKAAAVNLTTQLGQAFGVSA